MPSSELYADGGVAGKNGQAQAGTWAWCLVENDQIVRHGCGFVTIEDVEPLTQVTNNVTELIALTYGLEAMDKSWEGHVYSDSINALNRVFGGWKMNNVPDWLQDRVRAVLHGRKPLPWTLLGGHPERCSLKEQEEGIRQDGLPLSKWNAWCDAACNQKKAEALEYMASKKPPVLPSKDALTLEGSMALAAVTAAEEKHVKGEEAPNIRKKEPELFDLIRADLARLIVEADPAFFKPLSDAEKWRLAHVRARRDFGMVLECVARNHAHITRAYPKYLRELIELATEREPERMKTLDAKHGISEEIAAADRGESPSAAESLQSQLSRTHQGEKPVGQEVPAGLFSDL